jgi:hypothetical protein
MFCLLLGLIILDSAVALQSPAKRVRRAPRLPTQCRGGALDASAIPGGEWYATELKSNPMRTRMWTSGAIAGGGDVLAQTLASQPFDAERLCAFVLVNALFIAPVVGPWFAFLARSADRARRETELPSWLITAIQTLADQTAGAFTVLSAFFVVNELFRWLVASVFALQVLPFVPALDAGVAAVRTQLMITMHANWKIWPVANYLNFAFVPAEFQLLASNVVAFFWSAILSALAN